MRLFGFGRKKEEPENSGLPEQESSEQEEENQDEDQGKQEKGKRRKRSGGGGSAGGIDVSATRAAANIERLTAKVEALSELRKTDAERSSRISEQIGELRNLILDKEAEIKEIGIKAVKAAETVEELQPENILSEVRKSGAKYQVLEAKIEAANALYSKVMEELKELRKKLAIFQGVDEIIKLNEETGSNLANIKRVEANIENQASKIGNIFVQFQKQAGELFRYRDAAAALDNEFKGIEKSVEELKVKAKFALITQEDLNSLRAQLRNEINKRLEGLEKTIPAGGRTSPSQTSRFEKDLDELKTDVAAYTTQKKFSEQLVIDTLKEAREQLAKRDEETKGMRAELNSLKEEIYETALELRKEGKYKNKEENHAQPKKQGQPWQEEVPGIENETAADFQESLLQLQQAIREGNMHAAITLYNRLRESYVQVVRSSLSESKKYSLRSQLLGMHKGLSNLISAKKEGNRASD